MASTSIRYPFAPSDDLDPDVVAERELLARCLQGDRSALEELVRAHQDWIYNIAVRMLRDVDAAEDATQDILLQVLTRLGSFRQESRFRTWLYRIAVNHLLNVQSRQAGAPLLTFTRFGAGLEALPSTEPPDENQLGADLAAVVEQAKVGCTSAMLLCLDPRQRIVFVLGELFEVDSRVGAEIVGVSPANFRQILVRARRDLYAFMNGQCGLLNRDNPCRCARKTRAFIAAGHVDVKNLYFAASHLKRIRDVVPHRAKVMSDVLEQEYAGIFGEQPFLEVADQVPIVRRLLEGDRMIDFMKEPPD